MNATNFVIRPILPEELDQVLAVYTACEDFLALGPQPHASMEMVLADLELSRQEKGIFCGIFLEDTRMAGIIDYVPSNFEDDLAQSFLSLLMIDSRFRNQGLGWAVMEWLEAQVMENAQVTRLVLGVQVNNPAGIRFWEKCGFVTISSLILNPDGTTCFRMAKTLRTPVPSPSYQGEPG